MINLDVSIQLLFRWNTLGFAAVFLEIAFQYNYCFGGTRDMENIFYYPNRFQYNYCFGGTVIYIQRYFLKKKFQYNYCFGGTQLYALILQDKILCFNTTIVSVELLLCCSQELSLQSFNTTIVSVELNCFNSCVIKI